MNININIQKKDLWLLSAIVVFLVGVGYVVAYNENWEDEGLSVGENAPIHGHSPDEVEGGGGFDPADINALGKGDESNGEVTFPNGLQIKWGKVNPPETSSYGVDFTSQGLSDFSNACFQVFLTTAAMDTTVKSSHDRHTNTRNLGKTGFTIYGDGRLVNWPHRWLAIGR